MLGQRLRQLRRYADNPEIANLRTLIRTCETGPAPAVVHLGASESLFVGPDDTDRRPLSQMIQQRLGPDVAVARFVGAGYPPALFEAVLRQLSRFDARPVVLAAVTVRLAQPPWACHPLYAYERATAWAQRATSPRRPWWAYRAAVPRPTAEQMARLDALPYRTVDPSAVTVGEYRRSLGDPDAHGLSPEQATARLYAYHHGSVDAPLADWLDSAQRFGATARALGFPVVTYEPPIPVQRGVELWGEQLAELNHRATDQVRRAFASGYGAGASAPTALMLGSDSFIDPQDATEHVNDTGRLALTDVIAPAVERALSAVAG